MNIWEDPKYVSKLNGKSDNYIIKLTQMKLKLLNPS